jgi:hypothetical protein
MQGSNSSRGLRFLSLKVKEIVCKETTYKDVAEKLVEELIHKEDTNLTEKEKVKKFFLAKISNAIFFIIKIDKRRIKC